MDSIALLFPGQGVDYRTADPALLRHPQVQDIFSAASHALGEEFAAVCAPDRELDPDIAPMVIFGLEAAMIRLLQVQKIPVAAAAGFSLGEYAALCAAGVFSPLDGIKIVAKRTELMNAAAKKRPGGMVAVLGITDEAAEGICAATPGFVRAVNYNCPGQIVLAGEREALAKAAASCLAAGARRAVPLTVSGAFHTELMMDAAEKLKEYLQGFTFHAPAFPVYANGTGRPVRGGADIPVHLAAHMVNPVRWGTLFENMTKDGFTRFAEAGPGNTLAGFAKRIVKEAQIIPLPGPEAIEILAAQG